MIGMLSFFSYRWDVYIYMGYERGIYGIYDIYIHTYGIGINRITWLRMSDGMRYLYIYL